jgi:HNH endonuclease
MTRRAITWLPEELAWLEANKTLPRATLHSGFCFRFGRRDVTFGALTSLMKRNGWMTGRTGGFEKGKPPMNKGKKMPFNAANAATRFKKGQRPVNKYDIGHEMVDVYGYVQVCIDQPNPWTGAATRMVHKHRWLWERAHGPVPEGHRLKCLDGNRKNCDPSNWEALPLGMAPRLNGIHGRGYDAAPAELKPVIMATAKLAHQAKARRGAEGVN